MEEKKENIEKTLTKLQREKRRAFIERMEKVGLTVNDNARGIYYSLLPKWH